MYRRLLFSLLVWKMKGDNYRIRRWLEGGAFLLLLLLVAGCSGPQERLWLRAPGWERAQFVGGTALGDPVPIAVDETNDQIYVLLMTAVEDNAQPRVVALDRHGAIVWERQLDVTLSRPDEPHLLWDGSQLHAFWIGSGQLTMARLDSDGTVVASPRVLATSLRVGGYDAALDADGNVIVWYGGTRRDPGLYRLPAVDSSSEPLLVDAEGFDPSLLSDDAGNLYAAWVRYPPGQTDSRFYYAFYPGAEWRADAAVQIAEDLISTSSVLSGPVLGATDETVYLFWTIEVRTGLAAGLVETRFITLAPGETVPASPPADLSVPSGYVLPYGDETVGTLEAGARVSLAAAGGGAVPRDLNPNQAVTSELVVALRAQIAYQLRKEASQVGLLYFRNGVPVDYQLLSFTSTASRSPYVISDAEQYLYLTWLEPAEGTGFRVYFASTAPDISAALATVSAADVVRIAAETLFGMLAGMVLSPLLGILWLIFPLIVLGITAFLRRESDRLISAGSVVSLALTLAAYWVVKVLTLPGIGSYVPFSAWIPILPSWSTLPLQWGILPLIFLVALVVAWRYTYGRETQSGLYFLLIYTVVDAPLTLAIYGAIIYGFI